MTKEAFIALLEPRAAKIKTSPLYYLDGPGVEYVEGEWCEDCIDAALEKHRPKDLSIGGGYCLDQDGPVSCEACGVRLLHSMTDYCVDAEIDHFSEHGITSDEDAYDMLEAVNACSDEQWARILSIAEKYAKDAA